MIIKVYLKDPDGFYDSIQESVSNSLQSLDLEQNEKDALLEIRFENIKEKLSKWIEYNECVKLEFDLEKMTAKVLER